MYGSCDQTHDQNERRAEKERITEMPVITGQCYITSLYRQTVQLRLFEWPNEQAFKKCVVIRLKAEAALLGIANLPRRHFPKLFLQI